MKDKFYIAIIIIALCLLINMCIIDIEIGRTEEDVKEIKRNIKTLIKQRMKT